MKKNVDFMLTAFRDGFQSVYGARVFSKDFLPAVEMARAAGIRHMEAGGGAIFQSSFFYCNESGFDTMDAFRKAAGPDANLQTLARGVNVVALDSQPKDIIDLHARLFKKHGITTIRNFDALNDVNNLIYSGQCIHNAGLKHEVVVTLMELPPNVKESYAHTAEFYISVLKGILDAGIPYDSVCFKDASGTSTPQKVYETIKQARKLLGNEARISFHTHETAGTSVLAYKGALEAGANQIDLSIAPVSGGTSQPDIVVMWHALRGTEFDLGIDLNKIIELEEYLKNCLKDYFMPPEALAVEPLIPFAPMPGGALTANTQMMRDNKILHKYQEVIAAMGETVAKGGFGTSVTPVSQFYFQQAFNNVMFGPWKKIADTYGKMVLGYFGKTPVAPDPEVVKAAAEQLGLAPTTESPLALDERDPNKGTAAAKKELEAAGLAITDENIFIAATCREKGIAFLKGQGKVMVRKNDAAPAATAAAPAAAAPKKAEDKAPAAKKPAPEGYTVSVGSRSYSVKLTGTTATVNGKTYRIDVKEGIVAAETAAPAQAAPVASAPAPHAESKAAPQPAPAAKPAAAPAANGTHVKAPLPGNILSVKVGVGSSVAVGDILLVLESMKMENPLKAPKSGIVAQLLAIPGNFVSDGETLVVIE
jgi:pyruvate carboxylase subunit B